MEPTLHKGDQVTVNLFAYVFREPNRGDIVAYEVPGTEVFRLHRIIALPGEVVAYDSSKQLSINGVRVQMQSVGSYPAQPARNTPSLAMFDEKLPGAPHRVLIDDQLPALLLATFPDFPHRDLCRLSGGGFRCSVPMGNYFVMGDNRDRAEDSRFIGFIPLELIGGRVEIP